MQDGADLDEDIEQASLAALSGSRSRMNAALTSIYASGQPPGGASPTASHTSMQPDQPQPEAQQQAHSASAVPAAVLANAPEQATTSSPSVLPGVSGAQNGGQVAIPQPTAPPLMEGAVPTLPSRAVGASSQVPSRSHAYNDCSHIPLRNDNMHEVSRS